MNVQSYILKLLVLPKSATFVIAALCFFAVPSECSIMTLPTPPGLMIPALTPPGIGK